MQQVQSNRGVPGSGPVPVATENANATSAGNASQTDSNEVKELKSRLAELEKQVSKLVPGKSKK